jgi:putative transposase
VHDRPSTRYRVNSEAPYVAVAAQTLKNRILLENYYLPGDLDREIGAFVEHYNHVRYHESIENVTPADVYFGRAQTILAERRRIKLATIANRRLQHRLQAA